VQDATSEAIRDWVTNVETTHYILGSAAGPHPYPMMVGASDALVTHIFGSAHTVTKPQQGLLLWHTPAGRPVAHLCTLPGGKMHMVSTANPSSQSQACSGCM
jgi:hypothetical protein